MPSISKKYSRKRRHSRKRGHSRRMRRKSRHASYYRRRRNMFGGEGDNTYEVTPFDAGNDSSNDSNKNALKELIDRGYVKCLTTDKFTDDILKNLSNTNDRIKLPNTDISLQKNRDFYRGMAVEVQNTDSGTLIGQVMLKLEYKYTGIQENPRHD